MTPRIYYPKLKAIEAVEKLVGMEDKFIKTDYFLPPFFVYMIKRYTDHWKLLILLNYAFSK